MFNQDNTQNMKAIYNLNREPVFNNSSFGGNMTFYMKPEIIKKEN